MLEGGGARLLLVGHGHSVRPLRLGQLRLELGRLHGAVEGRLLLVEPAQQAMLRISDGVARKEETEEEGQGKRLRRKTDPIYAAPPYQPGPEVVVLIRLLLARCGLLLQLGGHPLQPPRCAGNTR